MTMLIISFSVSETAPQGSQASGAGRGAVWNLEGGPQVSKPGEAQCSELGCGMSALEEAFGRVSSFSCAGAGLGYRAYACSLLWHLHSPGKGTSSWTDGEAVRKQPLCGRTVQGQPRSEHTASRKKVIPAYVCSPCADNFLCPTPPSHGGFVISEMAQEAVVGTEALWQS